MLHKDVRYERRELSNGIPVYFALSPHATNMRVTAQIDVGSAYERPGYHGAAHALEHTLFLGTRNNDQAAIAGACHLWDGISNASTSKDKILVYSENTQGTYKKPKAQFWQFGRNRAHPSIIEIHVIEMLGFILDCISNPTFPDEITRRELKIIGNEIGFRHDTDCYSYDVLIPQLYSDGYGHNVGGTKLDVSTLTPQKLKKFWQEFFVSNNVSLFVSAPDVEIDIIMQFLEENDAACNMRSGEKTVPKMAQIRMGDIRDYKSAKLQNEITLFFGQELATSPRMDLIQGITRGMVSMEASAKMRQKSSASYLYTSGVLLDGQKMIYGFSAYSDPDDTAQCVKDYVKTLQEVITDITNSEQALQQRLRSSRHSYGECAPKNACDLDFYLRICQNNYGDHTLLGEYFRATDNISISDIIECAKIMLRDPVATLVTGPKPENMPTLAEIRELVGASPLPVATPATPMARRI